MKDYIFIYLVDPYGNIRLRYTRIDRIPKKYQHDMRDIEAYMLKKHGKNYSFSIYEIWRSDNFDHWDYMTKMYPKNVRV
jgi:hypothetical protein